MSNRCLKLNMLQIQFLNVPHKLILHSRWSMVTLAFLARKLGVIPDFCLPLRPHMQSLRKPDLALGPESSRFSTPKLGPEQSQHHHPPLYGGAASSLVSLLLPLLPHRIASQSS